MKRMSRNTETYTEDGIPRQWFIPSTMRKLLLFLIPIALSLVAVLYLELLPPPEATISEGICDEVIITSATTQMGWRRSQQWFLLCLIPIWILSLNICQIIWKRTCLRQWWWLFNEEGKLEPWEKRPELYLDESTGRWAVILKSVPALNNSFWKTPKSEFRTAFLRNIHPEQLESDGFELHYDRWHDSVSKMRHLRLQIRRVSEELPETELWNRFPIDATDVVGYCVPFFGQVWLLGRFLWDRFKKPSTNMNHPRWELVPYNFSPAEE